MSHYHYRDCQCLIRCTWIFMPAFWYRLSSNIYMLAVVRPSVWRGTADAALSFDCIDYVT